MSTLSGFRTSSPFLPLAPSSLTTACRQLNVSAYIDTILSHSLCCVCAQVIDVNSQRLQNVITFPPSGTFIVDSSIAVESAQRVSFKFNAAKLKTASKDWGVPPFGQGW